MRVLGAIVTFILAVILSFYIALFTPIGNSLLSPYIQNQINTKLGIDGKIEKFSLDTSTLELSYATPLNNKVLLSASYMLFNQDFSATYTLDAKDLSEFNHITNQKLKGELGIKGSAKGNLENTVLSDGKIILPNSTATYYVELDSLELKKISIDSKELRVEDLLNLLSQSSYANGILDVDIDMLKSPNLKVEAKIKSKNATLNSKVMLDDFNITIPQTSFNLEIDSKMQDSNIIYQTLLTSNLFNINSHGLVDQELKKIDIAYLLDIQNLELLKPLTKQDIRGSLKLDGVAKGSKELLNIEASSDIASSKTTINAKLQDFSLKNIDLKTLNLDIAKLLYMLKQPHYLDGALNLDAKISYNDSINGVINTLLESKLDSKTLTKEFNFKSSMPQSNLKMVTSTNIDNNLATSTLKLDLSLASLDMPNIKLNLKDSSLNSDFSLKIPNLNELFFITQTKLKGAIKLDGNIKQSGDLLVDFNIKDLNAKGMLKNDDLSLKISNINSKKLLYMLDYKEILNALVDVDLKHNITLAKTDLKADIKDGIFEKNNFFELIKNYTKTDPYQERFNGSLVASKLQNQSIIDLDLVSKKISLTSKKAKIADDQVDAKVVLNVDKAALGANLKGDINAPNISIDLEDFLNSKAGQKAIIKVDKFFQKLMK